MAILCVRWTKGVREACCLEKSFGEVLGFLDRNVVESVEDRPASNGKAVGQDTPKLLVLVDG